MHAIASLSLLALAGSVLAAPVANVDVVYVTDIETVVVTAEATQAAATVYETQTQQQQLSHTWSHHHHSRPTAATTVIYQAPPQQTTEQPQPTTTEQPTTTSTPAPAASGYMGTVNEWRGKLGLPSLAQDATLEANALKTCSDHPGQMVHELNSGSNAQVLAPGGPDDFVKVFVGGWLCEKPTMSGMDGICDSMSQGWSHDGETGHADILSSTSYTKIGCANYGGIWGCDLTF